MADSINLGGMYKLTPVEFVGGTFLKREDKFAPLGYGGINGSKVRQCMYLVNKYVEYCKSLSLEPKGLVSGASVKSSQLAVGTIVADSHHLPSVHVIGATTPETAIKHEQVRIAHHFGAKFVINKVAYNPALQKRVNELVSGPLKGWFKLEYGSSLDHKTHSSEEVRDFHKVGAHQLQNMPKEVDTLIVPTGSCNTLVSIIYGIALYNIPIERVICLQIGPDKFQVTQDKLYAIEQATNMDLRGIKREYHDLSKRWSYQKDVPYTFEGIEMHPTYEGKCFKYLEENPELLNEHSCFWVTGSKPYLNNMVKEPEYKRIELLA